MGIGGYSLTRLTPHGERSREIWHPSLNVFRSPISPMGHLKFCLEYATKSEEILGGVFQSIRTHFGSEKDRELADLVSSVYQFRNRYIAHQEHSNVPKELAHEQLQKWAKTLTTLYTEGAVAVASPA